MPKGRIIAAIKEPELTAKEKETSKQLRQELDIERESKMKMQEDTNNKLNKILKRLRAVEEKKAKDEILPGMTN